MAPRFYLIQTTPTGYKSKEDFLTEEEENYKNEATAIDDLKAIVAFARQRGFDGRSWELYRRGWFKDTFVVKMST